MTRSHGEVNSLAQYWKDVPNADTEEQKWLQGPRISLQDLTCGGPARGGQSGQLTVERLSSTDWWKATSQRGAGSSGPDRAVPAGAVRSGNARRNGGGQPAKGPLRVTFGQKHNGKLAVDVREEDPGWWAWAMQNVGWWAAKVREAGLDEDVDA